MLPLFYDNYIVVNTDHNGGSLDDRISSLADLEAEFLDGGHGDGGADDVAAADVYLDDAVDGALLNGDDGSLELISCTEFHGVIFFLR